MSELKSVSLFLSYVPQTAKELKNVWESTVSVLNSMTKFGRDDWQQSFKLWPRISPTYCRFINTIVQVGKNSPVDAISALTTLIPSQDHQKSIIYHEITKFIQPDTTNLHVKDLYLIFIYFCFVDSVSQLITYTPDGYSNEILLDFGNNLFKKDFNHHESKYRLLFEKLLIRVLEQASVFVSRCAIPNYQQTCQKFSSLIQNSKESAYVSRVCVFYRFIRHPTDGVLNFIIENLLPLVHNRKLSDSFSYIYENIKWAMYQLPVTPLQQLASLAKLFEKPDSSIKKIVFIYRSLLISRTEGSTLKTVNDLLEDKSTVKELKDKPEVLFKGFLSMIRGTKFYHDNEFWVWGDHNGRKDISLENVKSEDEKSNKPILEMFKKHILAHISNSQASTKIIFNLLSRDIEKAFELLIPYFQYKKLDDPAMGAFLCALTMIYNPKAKFMEDSKRRERLTKVEISLKSILDQKLGFTVPDYEDEAYSCRSISMQNCPSSISIDDKFLPEEYQVHNDRIENAERKVSSLVNYEKFPFPKLMVKSNLREQNTDVQGKAIIYLYSLYLHVIGPNEPKSSSIISKLIKLTMCNADELVFFALYAIQVYYIQKPFVFKDILCAINEGLAESIGKRTSFTLLNLLYQILSLPDMLIGPSDHSWFIDWSTKLQALLIIHLTSPYIEVRDIVLLIIQRIEPLLYENGIEENIANLMFKYRQQIAARVNDRLTRGGVIDKKVEFYFEDVARSTFQIGHTIFLTELCSALIRESLNEVIYAIHNYKISDLIQIPAFQKRDTNTDEYQLMLTCIPYIALVQKMLPISETTISILSKYQNVLPKGHYLSVYNIDPPFYINSRASIANEAKKLIKQRIEFINSSVSELFNALTSGHKWAFCLLSAIAVSSNIECAQTFLAKLFGLTKTLQNEPKAILNNTWYILKLAKSLIQNPDFCLILAIQEKCTAKIEFVEFFKLCMSLIPQVIKAISEKNPNFNQEKAIDFLQTYIICIKYFADSIKNDLDPGSIGSIRGYQSLPWFDEKSWNISDRKKIFESMFSLSRSYKELKSNAYTAMISFLEALKFVKLDYFQEKKTFFLGLEQNEKLRVLSPILIHSPELIKEYIDESVNNSITQAFYFFRAYCEQYLGDEDNDINTDDISEIDKKANEHAIENAGNSILLALIYLSSSHEEARKYAFNILKRLIPVFSAYNDPTDLTKISVVNGYLIKHQTELSALAFPPSSEQIFELSNTIAMNHPYLAEKVFSCLLKNFMTEKFLSGDTPMITSLLNAAAPFARLTSLSADYAFPVQDTDKFTPHKLISELISRFNLIKKSNHDSYSRLFVEMCYNSTNTVPLVRLLLHIGTESPTKEAAIVPICLNLVQSHPSQVLSMMVQPFTFANSYNKTFNTAVAKLDGKTYDFPDWTRISFKVFNQVAQLNFPLLFPYIHFILQYCFLFVNDTEHHDDIVSLLTEISKSFNNPIQFSDDFILTYKEIASPNYVTIEEIVEPIIEEICSMFPAAIASWEREALQWLTGCSNLSIATRSGYIYSSILSHPMIEHAMPIMSAIASVLESSKSVKIGNYMHEQVYPYFQSALSALYSITSLACQNDKAAQVMYIYIFAAHFIYTINDDVDTADVAIQILSLFVSSKNVTNVEQYIPTNINGIAKMIPLTFNQGNAYTFLTAIITNLPASSAKQLKALSLALLLPVFYSAVSAYHSILPWSTFVEDEIVLQLFDDALLIGSSKFDGDAKYAEIFKIFFEEDNKVLSNTKPKYFMEKITDEMWRANPECIEKIGQLFTIMASVDILPVRAAVFAVTMSFLHSITKKEHAIKCFETVLPIAIRDGGPVARDLISTFGVIAEVGGAFSANKQLKTYPPSDDDSHHNLFEDVKSETESLQDIFVTDGEISIQDQACVVPMLPNIDNDIEIHRKQLVLMKKLVIQPFANQLEFWSNMLKEPHEQQNVQSNPTAFDIFAHARAETGAGLLNQKQYAQEPMFDPECFLLRDEELDEFEKRIL